MFEYFRILKIKCNLPDDTVAMKRQKVAAANPVAPKRERYFRFVVLFIVRLRMYNDAFPYVGYAEYVGCELARKCFALIKVKIYFLVEYLLSLHKIKILQILAHQAGFPERQNMQASSKHVISHDSRILCSLKVFVNVK